ncbi:MAG: hypothetical protein EBU92_04700 [Betaproteobacteria bacterium]|nr:hypothetical protein [Betaproteobacteria bacterium]
MLRFYPTYKKTLNANVEGHKDRNGERNRSGALKIIDGKFHLNLLNVAALAINVSSGDRGELTLVTNVLTAARGGTSTRTITRSDCDCDGITVVIQPELFECFEDGWIVRGSQSDIISRTRANDVVQTVACSISVGAAI